MSTSRTRSSCRPAPLLPALHQAAGLTALTIPIASGRCAAVRAQQPTASMMPASPTCPVLSLGIVTLSRSTIDEPVPEALGDAAGAEPVLLGAKMQHQRK